MRASPHDEACPVFERAGGRPEAVKGPINAAGVARTGDALDVTWLDRGQRRRGERRTHCCSLWFSSAVTPNSSSAGDVPEPSAAPAG